MATGVKIRVLIVDDSPTIRLIIAELLAAQPDIEISGQAGDGAEALEKVALLNPDIIIMDVQMPVMNGFEATEQIMAHCPKPILILSSVISRSEVFTSLRAIELGALDVMEKPEFSSQVEVEQFTRVIVEKIRMLSRIQVITHVRGKQTRIKGPLKENIPIDFGTFEVVAIGASTGGPLALKILFSGLDPLFDIPMVVVQHITSGFLEGLSDWLRLECKRKIVVARDSQPLEKGHIYFIPNAFQPKFSGRRALMLDENQPEMGGFKPSADALFNSVAEQFGGRAIGVLLTGMGNDGARGLLRLREAGGITIAQDQVTSIVYGMPRAAAELGAPLHVLPINQIPCLLNQFITGSSSNETRKNSAY